MAIRAAMCADRKQNEEKIVREWQINIYFIRPIKNNGINLKLAGKIKHVPQCNYCVMHLSARSFHFLGFFHFFFHWNILLLLSLLFYHVLFVLFICGIECPDAELCQLMRMDVCLLFVLFKAQIDVCIPFGLSRKYRSPCICHETAHAFTRMAFEFYCISIISISMVNPWSINQTMIPRIYFILERFIFKLLCDLQFRMAIRTFARPKWHAWIIYYRLKS